MHLLRQVNAESLPPANPAASQVCACTTLGRREFSLFAIAAKHGNCALRLRLLRDAHQPSPGLQSRETRHYRRQSGLSSLPVRLARPVLAAVQASQLPCQLLPGSVTLPYPALTPDFVPFGCYACHAVGGARQSLVPSRTATAGLFRHR